ncbi:MAG TPA: pyrroline-5-carboxylate reductase [Ruminiclostridium sp.]|nr:pyrroline-5-carboxylate reductase [Ruminiclostridium sp.]
MAYKVGFIGTGNMGGAIIRSIVHGDTKEYCSVSAFDVNTALLEGLSAELGITAAASASELVKGSDIIILAVKPQYCENVLKEIRTAFTPEKILVSIIVGVPISYYENILGKNIKIIRTMPNTPAMVGEGMTLLCCNNFITPLEKQAVMKLLSFSGIVEELDESLMSEVTALTSSSPAYVFIFIEAMADAAVQSGIPRKLAYRLAAQAVLGSAKMVLETGRHPGELKDMVCSPAGTTIEAVAALEREGFRNAVITAMGECTKKAREIGQTKK